MRDDEVETAALPAVSGMADLSGSVVADRYRLAEPLGQGAMANVYRAVDERLDRPVAVKLFHPGPDTGVRARFAAEAQALGRLSGPGLIGIYDAGVEGDRPYLVMQLIDGESLRDRLLNGPLTSDEVVTLGTRLSLALAHVHRNGIVHRDIKPSNIVLDGNGLPHLADFGIALLLDAARMTGSNEIMGTAAYLAPEQILGAEVGAAADVYSLGLVLLECLTGELEYPGGSKVESALARLHRRPRMPDGIAPVLAQLLTAMTSLAPEDRPAARECAAWFVAVREHGGVSSRATRLAAAHWLAHRGRQIGSSRTKAPLFSGWRRLAIAGSGLAMAIFASAWLFTSLLPTVMPVPPIPGGDAQTGTSSSGGPPAVATGPNQTALHVAVAMTTTGTSTPGTTSTVTVTPTTGSTRPGTGSPSVPPTSSGPSSTTTPDPATLQSDTVLAGPPVTTPTTTADAPPTTTDTSSAPASEPVFSTATTTSEAPSQSPTQSPTQSQSRSRSAGRTR
jgi:serine/threonine protein kinase